MMTDNNNSEDDEDDYFFNDERNNEMQNDDAEIVAPDSNNTIHINGNDGIAKIQHGDSIGIVYNSYPPNEETDTSFACGHCQKQVDSKGNYGEIICPHCSKKNFIRNEKRGVDKFSTIRDEDTTAKYFNITARINNHLIKKEYEIAYKYCIKAEAIAPGEPVTWIYFSRVAFYYEMTRKKDRKGINTILQMVHQNIKICKANNVDKTEINAIKGEIGDYIFYLTKSKLGSYYGRSQKDKKYWSRRGLHLSLECLKLFENCYRLAKDIFYLKSYVEELSRPYKWIVQEPSHDLINLPSCGKTFNAIAERERVIKKIKKNEPDYLVPEVAIARVKIIPKKEEHIDNKSATNLRFN